MLGLLSYALKQVIIELCQEKSSNHEKHGWNFYSQAVFLQPLLEVAPGFEPGTRGFADLCLTTWLCHHINFEKFGKAIRSLRRTGWLG